MKMKLIIAQEIVILLALYINSGFCAFELTPTGGRTFGMGQAVTAFGKSPEALFYNPANLSHTDQTCLLFSYFQPFGLKELSSRFAGGILDLPYVNLGFAFHNFGNELYQENTIAMGAGSTFWNRFGVGMLVRFLSLEIFHYGSAETMQWDTGLMFRFRKRTVWGASMSNCGRQSIGRGRELLPQIFRMGIAWNPADDILCSAEWNKQPLFPSEFKVGIEWNWMSFFKLRSGFQSRPSSFSFGFGLFWKGMELDYGSSFHLMLGTTHVLSVLLTP